MFTSLANKLGHHLVLHAPVVKISTLDVTSSSKCSWLEFFEFHLCSPMIFLLPWDGPCKAEVQRLCSVPDTLPWEPNLQDEAYKPSPTWDACKFGLTSFKSIPSSIHASDIFLRSVLNSYYSFRCLINNKENHTQNIQKVSSIEIQSFKKIFEQRKNVKI